MIHICSFEGGYSSLNRNNYLHADTRNDSLCLRHGCVLAGTADLRHVIHSSKIHAIFRDNRPIKILTVNSDPLPFDLSSDRQILQAFLDSVDSSGRHQVQKIDLYDDPPPYYDAAVYDYLWNNTPQDDGAREGRTKASGIDYLLRHCEYLRQTQILVLAVPVWNSSMPAVLKAWIDLIISPQHTYRFGENGIEPLHDIGRLLLLVSSGGGRDKVNAGDHFLSILTGPFKYIGIPEFDVIWADCQEPALFSDHQARLEQACDQARQLALELATSE